jgi:hypothetical protein
MFYRIKHPLNARVRRTTSRMQYDIDVMIVTNNKIKAQ